MQINWFRRKQTPGEAEQDRHEEPEEELEEDEFEEEEEEDDYEPETEREEILERAYAWGAEWSQTPAFEALSTEEKDEAEYVTQSFAEYMYTYHDVTPEEWNVQDMEACCLETLPRKISADENYFRAIAPVLASFFRFLGETGRLCNASKMADRIRNIAHQVVRESQDPRNWGFAKAFVMKAQAAGVDLTNEAEMNAFTARYNEQIMAESDLPDFGFSPPAIVSESLPYERPGLKVGRNDPCPCGSGKKYKKCCGNT